jgi:hypothetical protein
MGMGGMGGGMGGMMGGMGGMMNIPPNFIPNLMQQAFPPGMAPVNQGGVFDVEDDLNLTPDGKPRPAAAPAAAKSPASPAQGAPHFQPIQIEVSPGQSPDDAWEKYFAAEKPLPRGGQQGTAAREAAARDAAVRDAVRRLANAKKFDHVIALCSAALRHGQSQRWMYEALVLAMQADNRPQEEIERVLMSAVEFASSPADLWCVGDYLERSGFPKRALQVFHQVAQIAPGQAEPFVAGFRVAQRLGDLEGIKWSTVGILCRAWPSDQAEIWKDAVHEAKAALAHLKADRRTAKEAQQYEKALDEAIARDCYVKVSWTGDADLDLFVEEPAGTVCSGQNPQTTSGGVLLRQSLTRWSKEMNGRGQSSEVYVCPQGFSGNYRLLVRRVFGKVTGDKVTVEVCTHYLTGKQQTVKQTLKLIKDQTAVAFQLADGRRREPLKQQQVANAALGQLATRQVLGQQIAQAIDPRTMMALNQARAAALQAAGLGQANPAAGGAANPAGGAANPAGGNSGSNNGAGGNPLANTEVAFPLPLFQGAVGYEPVIITLPEGTNLSATAVVSADRRYVRVSCMPLFSGVAQVNTFNTSTGATAQTNSGAGFSGYSGTSGQTGASALP